jgi:hypothetical protein
MPEIYVTSLYESDHVVTWQPEDLQGRLKNFAAAAAGQQQQPHSNSCSTYRYLADISGYKRIFTSIVDEIGAAHHQVSRTFSDKVPVRPHPAPISSIVTLEGKLIPNKVFSEYVQLHRRPSTVSLVLLYTVTPAFVTPLYCARVPMCQVSSIDSITATAGLAAF